VVGNRQEGHHQDLEGDRSLRVADLLALEDHIRREADPDLGGMGQEDLDLVGNPWVEGRILLEDDRLAWAGHHLEGAGDVAEEGVDLDLDRDLYPDQGGRVVEDRRLQGQGHAVKQVLGGHW